MTPFKEIVKILWYMVYWCSKSSAVAEMAAQCDTSLIFAFEWGYLSSALFLSILECRHDHMLLKTRFFGLLLLLLLLKDLYSALGHIKHESERCDGAEQA